MKSAILVAITCLLMISCGVVESPFIPGSQAAAAKNQIMLVTKDPPSFGYERLVTQCHAYPDLGSFTKKHGIPDFLAETGNRERRYFILYYLRTRHAFVCRTRSASAESVEFSGAYPITKMEYKLLDGFRSEAVKKHDR